MTKPIFLNAVLQEKILISLFLLRKQEKRGLLARIQMEFQR